MISELKMRHQRPLDAAPRFMASPRVRQDNITKDDLNELELV